MGYFSNGSEGDSFRTAMCEKCVHDINQDCPVWLAHLLWNYKHCNDKDSILHLLIPRDDEGRNGDCKMFIHRTADHFRASHDSRGNLGKD